ncbi:hypothetical protein FAI41_04425 [Acetobacteraceae bacterium]|nr:hypothetical protein FAI41_04425 [Acetobacteraceae bacterium]
MNISDQDFKDYYINPAEHFACREDWDMCFLFPEEAETSEEGKRKALNALYRFVISGIAKFAFVPMMKGLKTLEDAPLDPPTGTNPEQRNKFADAWMGTIVIGTPSFIKEVAPKMGLNLPEDVPLPADFRENLNAIFQKHNVGLEKGDVYPPYLEKQ